MDLSVVVPTLNGRDRLTTSLDSLAERAPEAEVVVVNGPSADGTTGMVRERDDVDVLVELSARTLNVARNAGIQAASGDAIAFLRHDVAIEEEWVDGILDGLADAAAVTGPTARQVYGGRTADTLEQREVCAREIVYFDGGNVAIDASALDRLDGFDEYLETGGARDLAHRLAGCEYDVAWETAMRVDCPHDHETDGGHRTHDYEWKYRALSYRLVKNYGLRPEIVRRTLSHAGRDAVTTTRGLLGGEVTPTSWFGGGRGILVGMTRGSADGLVARARDQTESRNPNGVSTRADRAVARYDWR